jgi:Na+/H+ antiporter NhaD/arsenite permease-like protein
VGAWEIIAFLPGMFVLTKELQNAGVVDRLSELYQAGAPRSGWSRRADRR